MKELYILPILLAASFNCWSQEENEIIELPIEMVNGIIPFSPSNRHLYLEDHITGSPWEGISVQVTGIPDEWTNAVVQPIWFDPVQLIYQGYKQGKLNESFFKMAVERWKIDLNSLNLSEEPIQCFSHIVLTKLDDGSIRYKVDTNNDRDFSDEEIFQPLMYASTLQKTDSLSKVCHWLDAEVFVDNQIKKVQFPYHVKLGPDGMIWHNFPHYGKATFKDKLILISSGFEATFRNRSDLLLVDPSKEQQELKATEFQEYIEIDGELYQNLGADFGYQVLRLKKMNIDESNLAGTQVGILAIPFSGTEFSSEKTIQLSDYKGKLLFLEFWGSWCGPCVDEIPKMKEIYERLDKNRVSFLGIAQDNSESLKNCMEKYDIPWEQILSKQENNIIQQYNITGFPSSFLIDERGIIIAKDLRAENLLETINKHLKEHNEH